MARQTASVLGLNHGVFEGTHFSHRGARCKGIGSKNCRGSCIFKLVLSYDDSLRHHTAVQAPSCRVRACDRKCQALHQLSVPLDAPSRMPPWARNGSHSSSQLANKTTCLKDQTKMTLLQLHKNRCCRPSSRSASRPQRQVPSSDILLGAWLCVHKRVFYHHTGRFAFGSDGGNA